MNMVKQQFILALRITFIFLVIWVVAVSGSYLKGDYAGGDLRSYSWGTFLAFSYINGTIIFFTVIFNVIYTLVFTKKNKKDE